MDRRWLFGSYFLAGFECSMHRTSEGRRIDQLTTTQHDTQAQDDYELCRAMGFRAIREAARWPHLDVSGRLDLAEVRRLARLGQEAGLVQIWDLLHYGYPDDLDPLDASDAFVERFSAFAAAVARLIRSETAGPTYYTPINEISYFAWSGGEVGYMAPLGHGRGAELKRVLVRAAIAAANAIWHVDPEARMVNVDPLVRLHAPADRPDLQEEVAHFNHYVMYEAFDMLAGRRDPELGGSRNHLGIIGLNYYASNQWIAQSGDNPFQFVALDDPRRVPLSELLLKVHERYSGPMIIGETGSWAEQRAEWITYLVQEGELARQKGADLQGICLYPIISAPDWEDPTTFVEGGFFDSAPQADGTLKRIILPSLTEALLAAQDVVDPSNRPVDIPTMWTPPPSRPYTPSVTHPPSRARFKPDNYSYQTLLIGAHLLLELYCFEPGRFKRVHRHENTEHILMVLAGEAQVQIGAETISLRTGEVVLIPAGVLHSITNDTTEQLVVQQVSSPKPWDARVRGPLPAVLFPADAGGKIDEGGFAE